MPLKKAVFLGLPPRGPHGDLREPFGRFFAYAKRSNSGSVADPEFLKKLIGDISKHVRGKEEEATHVERVRTFHVEERKTFDPCCDRLLRLLNVRAAQNPTTPGQYAIFSSCVMDCIRSFVIISFPTSVPYLYPVLPYPLADALKICFEKFFSNRTGAKNISSDPQGFLKFAPNRPRPRHLDQK